MPGLVLATGFSQGAGKDDKAVGVSSLVATRPWPLNGRALLVTGCLISASLLVDRSPRAVDFCMYTPEATMRPSPPVPSQPASPAPAGTSAFSSARNGLGDSFSYRYKSLMELQVADSADSTPSWLLTPAKV